MSAEVPTASGDDVLQGDVPSEVDDVESGDLQHDGDDVLSDGVDVTLDGADHELSESLSGGGTGLLDLGGQDVDTGVHRVGGSHDVGQVQLLGLEELTDLLDTGGESLFSSMACWAAALAPFTSYFSTACFAFAFTSSCDIVYHRVILRLDSLLVVVPVVGLLDDCVDEVTVLDRVGLVVGQDVDYALVGDINVGLGTLAYPLVGCWRFRPP